MSKSDPDALVALRVALAVEASAKAAAEAAAYATAKAIRDAHAAGLTWPQLGQELGGISASAARWRSYADEPPPSVVSRRTDGQPPAKFSLGGPGVGVSEASRRLGVSRQWVYELIARGELKTIEGTKPVRILLEEAATVNPAADSLPSKSTRS